jgi:hypothetical protein
LPKIESNDLAGRMVVRQLIEPLAPAGEHRWPTCKAFEAIAMKRADAAELVVIRVARNP